MTAEAAGSGAGAAGLRRVGVVGAGVIGTSVVADLLLHGAEAVLVDRSDDVMDEALRRVAEGVRFGPVLRPGLPVLGRAEALARVEFTTDLQNLAGCSFVIENVTELWSVKRDLYGRLDDVLRGRTPIGVNTSSIQVGRLAALTCRPGAVVGVHFMNPCYATTAVEVMRAGSTDDETLRAVLDLAAFLGKSSIVVGDNPGFVSNRLSHVLFNEAARLVQEAGVKPAVIDEVMRRCFGHRMGPLETADLIGLDTVTLTLRSLHEETGESRYAPCSLLEAKVAAGELGRKAGRGFYDH